MQPCHHGMNFLFLVSMGINQNQVLTGLYVVVETVEFLVFRRNTREAALPRAKTAQQENNAQVGNKRNIGTEWIEDGKKPRENQAGDKAQHCAYKAFPKHIKGFKVIAGMKAMATEPFL